MTASNEHLQIAPHSTAKFKAEGLYSVVFDATFTESRYLQSQLGVQGVQFADGTSWLRTPPERVDIFDLDLLQADSPKCAGWPLLGRTLDRVLTVRISGAPRDAAPVKGTRYMFFCDINDGTAFCVR